MPQRDIFAYRKGRRDDVILRLSDFEVVLLCPGKKPFEESLDRSKIIMINECEGLCKTIIELTIGRYL